jgi:heme acquisition protein HasR
MRFGQVWLAVILALGGRHALAQEASPGLAEAQPEQMEIAQSLPEQAAQEESPAGSDAQASDQEAQEDSPIGSDAQASDVTLDEVKVTGTAEEEQQKTIGNTAGADKEDIERRNASHMSDLIDQISGTSVNSLYSRPEVSVGVQGIAGHGRVSQSLEGVTQNFHAFTKDIGQTGSIFVEPQFLRAIEVTRGVNTGTGMLGSLGGAANFRYMDLNDILFPGKNVGGMIRFSTGFSKYANGQKPSGSVFLGGRSERWEVMLGASDSENDPYRVGSNMNDKDMLRYFHATNMNFWENGHSALSNTDNCRYVGIVGASGGGAGWFQ